MPAKASKPKAADKGPFSLSTSKASGVANVGRSAGKRGPARGGRETPRKG